MEGNSVTFVGNLTRDPEIRFTPSGVAVANFTVAHTPRQFDKQSGEWKDLEPVFLNCVAWRDLGENVAASLTKGARVFVGGHLKANNWEKDGEKRTSLELEVTEVGPSLRYATATVTKKSGAAPRPTSEPQAAAASAPAPQAAPAPAAAPVSAEVTEDGF